MHAALIADADYLDDELTEFRQLCAGLIDEQVQLTRVVPAGVVRAAPRRGTEPDRRSADADNPARDAEPERRSPVARQWRRAGELDGDAAGGPTEGPLASSPLFGSRLTWEASRYGALDHRRLVRLAEPLADANVMLIHALSRGVWSAAATLGEQLDAAVIFRAADWSDADHAARLVRQLRPTRCVLVAASGPLAAELRRRTQNLVRVETVFPGVHVQVPRAGERQPGDPLCVAVAGSGVLDDAYRALLSGIEQVVAQHPATQFFFDTPRTDPHRLWRETERRGLLGHVSFVPRRPGHRDLLLTADALVLPQATGRTRGVTLRAMARAVPVIAADDPSLDELTHDHTAWVLQNPDAAAWAEALLRVVATPDEANDLGLRARAWVHEERLASDQIGRLLNLYHTMTGEPIGFVGQGGNPA